MKKKKLLACFLTAALAVSLFAGCGGNETPAASEQEPEAPSSAQSGDAAGAEEGKAATPREETLIVSGTQTAPPSTFNYFTGASDWPAVSPLVSKYTLETLANSNILTNEIEPSLAESWEYTDDYTIKVTLHDTARFNDGVPLTAEDVKYSYEMGQKYDIAYSTVWLYLDSIELADDHTLIFHLSQENYNALIVEDSFLNVPIQAKHVWEPREEESGHDLVKLKEYINDDLVGSGPYKLYYYDDTKITLIRDDEYWGNAVYHDGKLPAPKYITHVILKSNDSYMTQFAQGGIDITNTFISQCWKLWEDGAPIGTWYKDSPYFVPTGFAPITFNVTRNGLENKDIRKAIAMSTDFEQVSEVAVSGYSAVSNLTQGLMMASEAEQFSNPDQWKANEYGYDLDAASALLDSAGAAKGADGFRTYNGETLKYELMCPYGWTDWNAALEIAAQGCQKIGINASTNFPDFPVYQTNMQNGDFDLAMTISDGVIKPSQPWSRFLKHLQQPPVPIGEMAFNNPGRYENARVGELIDLIPKEKDEAKVREYYTELNNIILDEVPFYNPYMTHDYYIYNETHWTGFPDENTPAGRGVLPGTDGANSSIDRLWLYEPVK